MTITGTGRHVARMDSILFGPGAGPADEVGMPACFTDLNLDQVEQALVRNHEDYRLEPYFRTMLADVGLVDYRHEVVRDLERDAVRRVIDEFADRMHRVRRLFDLAGAHMPFWERSRWYLDACLAYVDAARTLSEKLRAAAPESSGLLSLEAYLADYLASPAFGELADHADRVSTRLSQLRYNVWLRGDRVTVGPYDEESDWSQAIRATFDRFAPVERASRRDRQAPSVEELGLDPIESRTLELVAQEFPEQFAELQEFVRHHPQVIDESLRRFDREVQFYVAWLDLIAPLRDAGLGVELPRVSDGSKGETVTTTFDLALALQLVPAKRPVVTNDLTLSGQERIWVITGPNNGGKTTMARTIGQLHYLAALGLPTPGRRGRLYLCDRVFTHFERREDPSALLGKLGEELARLNEDFAQVTPRSLVIMNEMFSSTASADALDLSLAILRRVDDLDALGVCVTFLDELSVFSPKAVSLVCGVDEDDPTVRTFKLVRRPADGLAHAMALARKHGLTTEQMKGRLI